MSTTVRNTPDTSRPTLWPPRPLWIGVLLTMLIILGAGLSLGLPIYREQVAIREIQRLRGIIRQSACGPQWLRKSLGEERMIWIDAVDRVDFEYAQIADSDLACLRGLRDLRELELRSRGLTGAGVVYLKDIPNLQSLSLGWELPASELIYLEELTRLQELRLFGPAVTDAGLAHLRPLTQLRTLTLSDRHITDAGIAHLKGLVELRRLRLSDTGITDAGLEHLKGMSKLEYLALDRDDISDAGLSHLLGLSNLRELYLGGTRVTDARILKKLPLLEVVYLAGSPVTDASVLDLKATLPTVRVTW